jgi:hypothetical protein
MPVFPFFSGHSAGDMSYRGPRDAPSQPVHHLHQETAGATQERLSWELQLG